MKCIFSSQECLDDSTRECELILDSNIKSYLENLGIYPKQNEKTARSVVRHNWRMLSEYCSLRGDKVKGKSVSEETKA